jgi:hypothetical protein
MFGTDEIAAFLDALGDDAIIGSLAFKVDFHGPFETVDYRSGDVVSSEPFALANPDDVELIGITGGDTGSVIAVMGRLYRVTAIEPDEAGFSTLYLGKP